MKALLILKKTNLNEEDFLHALRSEIIPTGVEKIADNVFAFNLEESSDSLANVLSFLNDKNPNYHVIYLNNGYTEFSKSLSAFEAWSKV